MARNLLEYAPAVENPGRMTFEEFVTWTANVRAEWVDGEVILMSPSTDSHQDLCNFLASLLRIWLETHRQGRVWADNYLMRLPNRRVGRVPDILCVTTQNENRARPTYLDGAADLVVEIVSYDSELRDKVEKIAEYEEAGVREYWLIDQEHDAVTFYQLGANGQYAPAVIGADGIYRSIVFAGLWIDVAWLWQRPLPQVLDVLKDWKLV